MQVDPASPSVAVHTLLALEIVQVEDPVRANEIAPEPEPPAALKVI